MKGRVWAAGAALLALGGCVETFTVSVAPTLPTIHGKAAPGAQLSSKRVRVLDGRLSQAPGDQVSSVRFAAAVTAAEAALLTDGLQPVARDDETHWTSDDGVDEARLIIRSVAAGVDSRHPLDGCRNGPHYYGYWVELDAVLVDSDGVIKWTGHVGTRSTDLLQLPARARADGWSSCDRLTDPDSLEALKEIGCDDFSSNSCDRAARSTPLVMLAAQRLVRVLISQVKVGGDVTAERSR